MSKSSSRSDEMSRMPQPRARASRSERQTKAVAPTSRPRVGCAAMIRFAAAIDLAREDQLLGIAAGKRTGRLGGGRIAHVPGVERLLAFPSQAARADQAERAVEEQLAAPTSSPRARSTG